MSTQSTPAPVATTAPSGPRATVIETRDVHFAYGDGPKVLEGLNFKVSDGEFLGLIGPNGGGKTTLIKLILGLMEPLAGEVLVFGRRATELGHDRRLLGYVPQDTG